MVYIFPVLFLVIILSITAICVIYLAKKINEYFSMKTRKFWLIIIGSVFILMFTGMLAFSITENLIGQIIFCAASLLAGFILYLLLSMLLIDIVNIFIKIKPKIKGFLSLIIALIVSLFGIWNASSLQVQRVEIPVNGLSKEIRAVHLTDIHLGHFRGQEYLKNIVNETVLLKPDIVFNTGDLFDARSRLNENVLRPFKEINVPHYFVEGNHDIKVGVEEINQYLRNSGVSVLENEIAEFGELQIIGLKHMLADENSFDMHAAQGKTIKQVLEGLQIENDKPAVMLHHSPDGANYANNKGVDFILAGHTHGGQMFPFTILSKLFFPYNSGLYSFKDLFIYVSEGAGTLFSPMRVGTNSEITLIRLVPAN